MEMDAKAHSYNLRSNPKASTRKPLNKQPKKLSKTNTKAVTDLKEVRRTKLIKKHNKTKSMEELEAEETTLDASVGPTIPEKSVELS